MRIEEQIIYEAGLFDGEGSIYITGRQRNSTIAIKLTNTDKKLCQLYYDQWGGSIQEIKPNKPNVKTLYRWSIYGKKAKPFLIAIQPYSIHKRQLIMTALEYIETIKYTSSDSPLATIRQTIKDKVYSLNT